MLYNTERGFTKFLRTDGANILGRLLINVYFAQFEHAGKTWRFFSFIRNLQNT
jgi:hypothetical protein